MNKTATKQQLLHTTCAQAHIPTAYDKKRGKEYEGPTICCIKDHLCSFPDNYKACPAYEEEEIYFSHLAKHSTLFKALMAKAQPAKKPGESDMDFLRRIHAVAKGC